MYRDSVSFSVIAMTLAQGKAVTPAEADRLSIALKELKDLLAKSETVGFDVFSFLKSLVHKMDVMITF